MGNKSVTKQSMFNETAETTHRKVCGICFLKFECIANNQRCMTCGIVGCRLCITQTISPQTDTYTIICSQCIDQKENKAASNYIIENLMKTVENHKDNGRELLVSGYIRALWISHCLLYDFDYTSRWPSNDVVQCITSWLYIQESFDKTIIDYDKFKCIKLTNCNQCIQRISMNDDNICHVFGTSSICFPGCKTWKFLIQETQQNEENFVIGIVVENKINRIGTLTASTFYETPEFGYGFEFGSKYRLKVNDIIVMTLNLGANIDSNEGLLLFKVYRDGIDSKNTYKLVDSKNTYKLAVAMYHKDKLTLLEEWW